MQRFVVVSGLPASGKTTLASALAGRLGLPHLDKDRFLEGLFRDDDEPSLERRSALSREADALFQQAALRLPAAVLSSWWRHPRSTAASGTPTAWLQDGGRTLFEVHCRVPPMLALQRFVVRDRHPGHADALRDRQALEQQFLQDSPLGPLFPGQALTVDTVVPLDPGMVAALAERVARSAGALLDPDEPARNPSESPHR